VSFLLIFTFLAQHPKELPLKRAYHSSPCFRITPFIKWSIMC